MSARGFLLLSSSGNEPPVGRQPGGPFCRTAASRGGGRKRAVLLAFFFFIPVPSFLSEYFGHCHVLLGTFEKVSGYHVGLALVRVALSFPGGGMEFVCWLPGCGRAGH